MNTSLVSRLRYGVGRAMRETGQALDRVGLRIAEKPIFKEAYSRHRPMMNLFDIHPQKAENSFVAPNASVVGDVQLEERTSVMYGAVVRGDFNTVRINKYSQVGDRAVVCTTPSVEGKPESDVYIGAYVVVGPGAVLQSCTVEDYCQIGAGATVMEGAVVEEHSVLADGAVVHPGRRIPSGQLWAGNPAVYVRDLKKSEMYEVQNVAEAAAWKADEHHYHFNEESQAYKHAEFLGIEKKAEEK